jgi:hypothetical protein
MCAQDPTPPYILPMLFYTSSPPRPARPDSHRYSPRCWPRWELICVVHRVPSRIPSVARSTQVCIDWLWKHCLTIFLPGNEPILMDEREYDRQKHLPILYDPDDPITRGTSFATFLADAYRLVTETRPVHNTFNTRWYISSASFSLLWPKALARNKR